MTPLGRRVIVLNYLATQSKSLITFGFFVLVFWLQFWRMAC